jgi:predicted ATPase
VDAVSDALGLPRSLHPDPLARMVEAIRERPWLLVLDNLEHLIEPGALLVRSLLECVPTLTCLATSRERLGVEGEQELAVMPLPTPRRSATLEQLLEYPSVQLFVDRARGVDLAFTATEANAAALAELCDRLEGLPLALELAAAWAQTLTPEQMVARLSRRFELLVSHRRDLSPRHRSLRTAMEGSYQRLPMELQQFFTRLSVFRGGWTLEAAEGVCDQPLAADYLRRLQECSLVTATAAPLGAAMRYRLLETLREFAAEQLEGAERESLAERHARFFLALAEQAEEAEEGANRREWLECLEREHDNLRTALEWSQTPAGDLELGLTLGGTLAWFWVGRGHLREGRKRLVGLFEAAGWSPGTSPPPTDLRTYAKALERAGQLAYLQGDFEAACPFLEASLSLARELGNSALLAHVLCRLAVVQRAPHVKLELYEESLALYRELGDERNVASTRVWLGLACQRHDPERARRLFHEALTAFRRLNDVIHLAWALVHLGNVLSLQGDYAAARASIEEALALFRALDDPMGIACCRNFVGREALLGGRLDEAERLHREALRLSREVGSQPDVAVSLCALGNVALARGDAHAAEARFEEALSIFPVREERPDGVEALDGLGRVAERQGECDRATARFAECLALGQEWNNLVLVMTSLERLACVAAAAGEPERGARLLGGVAAQREALGVPRPPHEQPEYDRHVASLRACLGEERFAAAWAAGRQMGPEQAVAEALGRAGPSHSE